MSMEAALRFLDAKGPESEGDGVNTPTAWPTFRDWSPRVADDTPESATRLDPGTRSISVSVPSAIGSFPLGHGWPRWVVVAIGMPPASGGGQRRNPHTSVAVTPRAAEQPSEDLTQMAAAAAAVRSAQRGSLPPRRDQPRLTGGRRPGSGEGEPRGGGVSGVGGAAHTTTPPGGRRRSAARAELPLLAPAAHASAAAILAAGGRSRQQRRTRNRRSSVAVVPMRSSTSLSPPSFLAYEKSPARERWPLA